MRIGRRRARRNARYVHKSRRYGEIIAKIGRTNTVNPEMARVNCADTKKNIAKVVVVNNRIAVGVNNRIKNTCVKACRAEQNIQIQSLDTGRIGIIRATNDKDDFNPERIGITKATTDKDDFNHVRGGNKPSPQPVKREERRDTGRNNKTAYMEQNHFICGAARVSKRPLCSEHTDVVSVNNTDNTFKKKRGDD